MQTMKILLIRFEKDLLHHIVIEDSNNIIYKNLKIEKTPFNSLEGYGKKYFQIIEELKLLIGRVKPDKIIYHSATKFMGKISEVRFANEGFLQYLCFVEQIDLIGIDKSYCHKKLGIKLKDLKVLSETEKNNLVNKKVITKTNIMMEGLVLFLLIKDKI